MSVSQQQVIEMPTQAAMEQHYTAADIARQWGLSVDTVRRLFEHEPGVLIVEPTRGRFSRRRYRTLRIPESIAERVHRRLSVVNSGTRG